MIQIVNQNRPLFILIHVIIGFLATLGFFPTPFGLLSVVACIGIVLFSGNKNEEAFVISSYVIGLEVFLRMIRGAPLYETGKYTCILILLIGLVTGQTKQRLTIMFPVYLMLLLLGIAFTSVPEGESIRKAIAFNLSGPFTLGICGIYFFKRNIKLEELLNAFFFFLLPVFSMVTFMYLRTPDFSEIQFGGVSLGETSGGFGPNQVATVLGFAVFLIGFFMLSKNRFTGHAFFDAVVLVYFTYRGLLTFSRGGIITGGACFVIFAFFYIIYNKQYSKIFQYLIIAGIFFTGVWLYTSNVTGGMIDNRYAGKNASGVKKADISAGRLDILARQFSGFQDAPVFGIGVGNGKYKRLAEGGAVGTSHNEMTRLIEEHGLIGLLLLLMLLFGPLGHFFGSNNFQRGLLISFYLFWLLTINHSAMRIAFPGFIYALSFLRIQHD